MIKVYDAISGHVLYTVDGGWALRLIFSGGPMKAQSHTGSPIIFMQQLTDTVETVLFC